MEKHSFLREMEDILDLSLNSLTGDEVLAEYGSWDSLAMLAFSVMAGEKLNREIAGPAIRIARTVNDLYLLACNGELTRV